MVRSSAADNLPKRGDRDGPGETSIKEIQSQLGRLSLTDGPANGVFDASMATALRRLQWYLVNRPWRLHVMAGAAPSTGLIESYTPGAVGITGAFDQTTSDALKAWVEGGYLPTTSLVRLNLTRLEHCERAATYTQLIYPGA